jgi:hypothetical protein
MTAQASGYPINIEMTQERAINRWWGIPVFGLLARAICAIPHLIVLAFFGIAMGIGLYVVWIPILINGRVPKIWLTIVSEIIYREARVCGWLLFIPGAYPSFDMGPSGAVKARVEIPDLTINRAWGIPMFGYLARIIAAIPVYLVMLILGVVLYLCILVVWIPVLLNGRTPDFYARYLGMYLRFSTRLIGWITFLPVPYPPFEFDM